VLPNPDLMDPSADQGFGFGAGSIAGMFEAALRVRHPQRTDVRFTRLGKPHAALFAEALRRSATREMVMIGDQLETDIQGARAFGLDAVWIGTGVTAGALTTILPICDRHMSCGRSRGVKGTTSRQTRAATTRHVVARATHA